MFLEPCCFNKQLTSLIESNSEAEHLFTFGDTHLPMLMDFLVRHAPGCEVYLTLPQVNQEAIHTIAKLMDESRDGNYLIRSMVLLSQGNQRKEIAEALGRYREEGRLIVCEDSVSFRCLCVGNGKLHFVLQGSIPLSQGYAMQMMTLTKTQTHYEQVMRILNYRKQAKQRI